MNRSIRLILNITVIGFILNLVWENAQAPLYVGYADFWQHFPACFRGALGDILIIWFLYGIFAIVYRDIWWIKFINMKRTIMLVLVGMAMAIPIEYWALSVGRWSYNASMPMFLSMNAGLWPVLQMMVLPYITFRLARKGLTSVDQVS